MCRGGAQASRPHAWFMMAKLWLDGKLAKRSLSRYLFRRVTGLFLLGPVAPKVI